jgi:hypothetical protein
LRKKNNVNGLLKGVIAIACIGLVLSFSGFGDVRAAPAQAGSSYIVSGQVTDATTGWPLYASITISGTGFTNKSIWTDPVTGNYSVSLPEGIDFNFNVAAWVEGYRSSDLTVGQLTGDLPGENVGISADTTACIAPGLVSTGFAEGFESATPPGFPAIWGETIVYGKAGYTPGNWASSASSANSDGIPAYEGSTLVYFNSHDTGPRTRARLYRTAGINMTSLSSTMLSFYMYHDTGASDSNDHIEIQVSTDTGATWSNVGNPVARFDGSTGWKQASIDLSAYASQTDLRLGLLGVSEPVVDPSDNIVSHGNDIYIDDIALGDADCQAQAGGLVVGNVYNDTAVTRMNGVTVSTSIDDRVYSATSAITGDPGVGDGFYSLFLPEGSHTLSAAQGSGSFSIATGDVSVVSNETLRKDFHLVSPALAYNPTTLQATLPLGGTLTIPFTLTNNGGYHATFKLQEGSGGANAGLSPIQGHGTWLSRATVGIPLKPDQADTELVYPSAYRWTPDIPSHLNVLLYADDLIYSPPNTYPDQALQALGIAYTAHYNGDFAGFETDLVNGKWDAVLYEGDNIGPTPTLAALLTYVQGGGKLGAEIWDMYNNYGNPLYATLGVVYAGNYINPTPAIHWWDATSPIFNNPDSVPEMPSYSCTAKNSCGQRVNPIAGVSTAVAGYAATSTTGQAALILRNDGNTVFKTFSDRANPGADANRDGIKDVVALWVNITDYLLYKDYPWLSESSTTGDIPAGGHQDVNITFDASKVPQGGRYNGSLFIFSNDPINRYVSVPVTMSVSTKLYLPLVFR